MIKRKIWPCAVSANQRGVVTVLTAISMVSLLGFSALVVDVGHMLYNQKRLDAATAAAALAGAQDLWAQSWATAAATATSYTGGKGKYNALPDNITVQAPTITGLKLTSVALPAANAASGFNAIKVQQTATVPMTFGPILGINSVNISSTSTASAGGGVAQPLNVEIVLDTTASMGNSDTSCGSGMTKLKCALNGAQSLIKQLSAAGDNVGLVLFPPVSKTTVTYETDCQSSPLVTLGTYMGGSSPNYWPDSTSITSTIIALTNSSNYMTNGMPNTSSPLMKAIGLGPSGCSPLDAKGGMGTYYAQAIYQAQSNLAALSAVNKQQNVMILLSDGDASASSGTQIKSTYAANQCQQAIVAANAAKTAKTWVYVIAYQAATSGGCSTDTTNLSPVNAKNIQPCATLKWLAGTTASNTAPSTISSYFYSDSTACSSNNSISSVSNLFKSISNTLMGSRLIPNNAT